ncbi:hypothetical protein RB614_16040 [Phytohabitans sp. ZYX-F-186]|uniref:Gram-positive cocci surface proteins LPxTG domain-containing protein n=1 Tax=Phytohabitans maris TaxID=3071409 RepID=A0ABU0ZHW8_9ACTN|nr:hypothetical protein [Phytohabitans sp. ZYX-F-186]MDQ7906024.1 hypothetical protein [Phytohabitans sp. ZYX-F-186]
MGNRLILRLAVLATAVLAIVGPPAAAAAAIQGAAAPASGGHGDMLFIAGAGIVMLVAVGALAAAQSRGRDAAAGPEPGPDPGDDPWV